MKLSENGFDVKFGKKQMLFQNYFKNVKCGVQMLFSASL